MNVLGIDPGLATGGMVLLESLTTRDRVIAAGSLVEKRGTAGDAKREVSEITDGLSGWGDREFAAAALRAERWIERFDPIFMEWSEKHGINKIAIESFVDQRSRAREDQQRLVRDRWKTPLLIGELATYLSSKGFTTASGGVTWQNAGVVIRQWSRELALLENRRARSEDVIFTGDHLVGNDHERKALAHAAALSLRIKRARKR